MSALLILASSFSWKPVMVAGFSGRMSTHARTGKSSYGNRSYEEMPNSKILP